MIDGPEGVLNCNEENKPMITDNSPPHIEKITIFWYVQRCYSLQ